MIRALIDRYEAGADVPARAIAGLTAEQLKRFPVPGTWSLQQIVLHLMDSDLIGADRMKRTIAEENPTLIGYDENAFARRLHYDKVDAVAAAEVFRLNRLMTATILRQMPDSAFDRIATHNETGRVTLGQQVAKYVEHLEHHAKFLRQKRKMVE